MLSEAAPLLGVALLVAAVALVIARARGRKYRRIREDLATMRLRMHVALERPQLTVLGIGHEGSIDLYDGIDVAGTPLNRATALGHSAWELLEPWPELIEDIRLTLHGERTGRLIEMGAVVLDVSCAPRFHDDGRVAEAIVTFRNATEEQRERERAERLAEVRSLTLAVMNYRMRSQMNGIVGTTDLLATSDLAEAEREWIAVANASGHQLMTFVEHLIAFLELDAERREPIIAPFSLRQLVDDAVADHLPRATADGTTLLARYPLAQHQHFLGDRYLLRELIDLLLAVAIGTNPGGQVVINVDEGARGASDSTLTISVEDSGRGLRAAALERVFDDFDSESAMWALRSGGSGLELPVARRLSLLIGGELSVESEPDVGTAFRLKITLERSLDAPPPERPPEEALEPVALRPGRVLVVDDGELQRRVARTMLERLGQSVTVASNGAEAIAALDAVFFDIVFTELYMPHMDGFETAAAIRSRVDGQSTIPIIALTADTRLESRRRCLRVGMDGVLTKPLETRALEAVLREQYARPRTVPRHVVARRDALDDDILLQLRAIDAESEEGALDALVRAFLAEAPLLLEEIDNAAADGDLERLRPLSATFAASSRMLGARRLQRLADALDQAVAEGDGEASRIADAALRAEFHLVSAELTELLQLWPRDAA